MNVTQFKNELHEGMYLKVVYHMRASEVGSIRKVSKIQTNGFYSTKVYDDKNIWIDYPKASEFASNDNLISFRFKDGTLLITYMVLDTIQCDKVFKLIDEVDIKELFTRAEKVDFNKDNDESYSGGFWDLAYEIAVEVIGSSCIHVDTQSMIYEFLWLRYEKENAKVLKEVL